MNKIIQPVRHGLLLSIAALLCGVLWIAYVATHHEQLHGGFEKQEAEIQREKIRQNLDMQGMTLGKISDTLMPQAFAHGHDGGHHEAGHGGAEGHHQHSHSGSLATDAMQRLMRGHIHWMGLGILSSVLLLIVAFTSLKDRWKKLLGWTFGIGTLSYPLAWILMGFRTVTMGPEVAESSVMWLFGPAVAVLLASLIAVLSTLLLETMGWHQSGFFSRFFNRTEETA